MNYNNATITDAGTELLQDLTISASTLRISKVKLGRGTYTEEDDLRVRTNLKSMMQEFDVFQVEKDTREQIRIMAIATNEGLREGYHMTEMGVYALDSNDNEVLLALAVAYDESETDYMPADDQTFLSSINIISYIKVSNRVTVTTVSDTGYAALSDYIITKRQVDSISVSDDGEGNLTLSLPI